MHFRGLDSSLICETGGKCPQLRKTNATVARTVWSVWKSQTGLSKALNHRDGWDGETYRCSCVSFSTVLIFVTYLQIQFIQEFVESVGYCFPQSILFLSQAFFFSSSFLTPVYDYTYKQFDTHFFAFNFTFHLKSSLAQIFQTFFLII